MCTFCENCEKEKKCKEVMGQSKIQYICVFHLNSRCRTLQSTLWCTLMKIFIEKKNSRKKSIIYLLLSYFSSLDINVAMLCAVSLEQHGRIILKLSCKSMTLRKYAFHKLHHSASKCKIRPRRAS